MASQDFIARPAPADIVAALSLTVGTRYTSQNLSQGATLFLREGATAPQATDAAYRVEPGRDFTITPQAGAGIWLWTDGATAIPVIATEAA